MPGYLLQGTSTRQCPPFFPEWCHDLSLGGVAKDAPLYTQMPIRTLSFPGGGTPKVKWPSIVAAGRPLGYTCSVFPDLLEPDAGNLEGQRHGTPDRLDANAKLSSYEGHGNEYVMPVLMRSSPSRYDTREGLHEEKQKHPRLPMDGGSDSIPASLGLGRR